MDPFHRGMTRYPVANEGDGTQIWRAAGNTLNKQPRIADDGVVLQLRGWARS